MHAPRVTLDAQLVQRVDAAILPGLYGASRNVRARFLIDWALVQFENEAEARKAAAVSKGEVTA
jgi:hypothetical protein